MQNHTRTTVPITFKSSCFSMTLSMRTTSPARKKAKCSSSATNSTPASTDSSAPACSVPSESQPSAMNPSSFQVIALDPSGLVLETTAANSDVEAVTLLAKKVFEQCDQNQKLRDQYRALMLSGLIPPSPFKQGFITYKIEPPIV